MPRSGFTQMSGLQLAASHANERANSVFSRKVRNFYVQHVLLTAYVPRSLNLRCLLHGTYFFGAVQYRSRAFSSTL